MPKKMNNNAIIPGLVGSENRKGKSSNNEFNPAAFWLGLKIMAGIFIFNEVVSLFGSSGH